MSAPLVTPSRDALAKAMAEHRAGGYFATLDGHRECYCGHVMAADESYETHLADALLTSGAVTDASTLANDEAAEDAFWREQEAGNTKRDRGGYYHDGFIDGYRALAAFLAERGEQHG